MPTYDYKCQKCSTRFEVRRSFKDDSPVSCPKCGGGAERLFSSVPIVLKGPGFYATEGQKRSWWQQPGMDECMADAKLDLEKSAG